jgi:molybdate transport system ATP-binding protein
MAGLTISLRKCIGGFSLDVEWQIGNELAVLFGYSGAGKSMTLQMIAGFMRPDEGFIRVDGRILFDSSQRIDIPPEQRHLGYVFQDLALFPHMTVYENIAYGANGSDDGDKKETIEKMIRSFQLDGLEDKRPAEISGGQKQRVAFARSLIGSPPVLLLDEPFSALDYPLRLEMRHFLRETRKKFDIPAVLVTHDVFEAYSMADTIIVYAGGRVAQAGSPGEVFGKPANADVAKLVSCRETSLSPFKRD